MEQTGHALDANISRTHLLRRMWSKTWPWLLIVGPAILCSALGYAGFVRYFRATGETHSAYYLLYVTLQLFTIESGAVDGPVPWQLEFARLFAPVAATWTLLSGLAALFRSFLTGFELRLMRKHNIVCGLGRKGLQLVTEFRQDGERVVVIEADEQNDRIEIAEQLGALVLTSDATQELVLRKARIDRARRVVAMCGDDGTNVEITVRCHHFAQKRRGGLHDKLRCYAQVVDLQLIQLLRRNRIFADVSDAFEASIVDSFRDAARLALEEQPLDRELIETESPLQIHLIIVGFGLMGQSLALRAAQLSHTANEKPLRLTVIDREVQVRKKAFLALYPAYAQLCQVEFVTADGLDPDTHARIDTSIKEQDTLVTVAVCLDNDSRCLSCALGIAARLTDMSVPVLVRLSEESGLATLLERDAQYIEELPQLRAFGLTSCIATRETLLGEQLDRKARAIHDDYRRRREKESHSPDAPSMRPWDRLGPDLKESNREHADHIPVKLRAIGCRADPLDSAAPPPEPFEYRDGEVELLARMEHARWRTERLLRGWTYAPGESDGVRKTSPYLIDWDPLPDDVKDYGRQAVRLIPTLLKKTGEHIRRG